MIIHIVLWKLREQPSIADADPPATFTDATATSVIRATQEQIDEFQAKARQEISAALSEVPGPLVPMQFGPPQLPERAKGYNFALYSKFKDRDALRAYDISEAHKTTVNNVVKPLTIPAETMAYDFELPDDA